MAHFDIAHEVGSREFEQPLRRLGLPARIKTLACGDFAFYGNGPHGLVRVGVERKTVSEVVGVASRNRYIARQLPRMLARYQYCFLIVEGLTKVDAVDGSLLCGKSIKQGKLVAWNPAGWGRERNTFEVYKKRELSLRLVTSTHVMGTADVTETAFLLHALYGWFQKPWKDHRSVLRVDTDVSRQGNADHIILDERTMRRETFAKWPHISWERSARVAKHFTSVREAANATEEEWMKALGVKAGRTMARGIVAFLNGEEREAKGE